MGLGSVGGCWVGVEGLVWLAYEWSWLGLEWAWLGRVGRWAVGVWSSCWGAVGFSLLVLVVVLLVLLERWVVLAFWWSLVGSLVLRGCCWGSFVGGVARSKIMISLSVFPGACDMI